MGSPPSDLIRIVFASFVINIAILDERSNAKTPRTHKHSMSPTDEKFEIFNLDFKYLVLATIHNS